jgi:glycosyltransferase involved in cell wall biosynthesis
MKLSVSVVIPCYNAEKYIAEAIASALGQTRPPDEVIVVDDDSTDSSVEVIRRFPVTLLRTGRNSGHAAARNVGIRAARGEAIAWLDADDRWDPVHLETVAGLLDANLGAAVAFSGVRFIGSREGSWVCRQSPGIVRDAFLECLRGTIVPAMSAVTRTQPVRSAGGFDESIRISPDYEFWLRLSRSHGVISIPETTAEYRWHPEQISRDPLRQLRSVHKSRADFIGRVARSESEAAAAELRRKRHAEHLRADSISVIAESL